MVGLSLVVLAIMAVLAMDPPDDVDANATVPVLELSDLSRVTALQITRPDDAVALQRDGDGWVLTGDNGGAADLNSVERLLDDLREGAHGVPLTDPSPLGEYGLDPAVASVVITLEGGATLEAVYGDETPVGWGTYALIDGTVVTVDAKPGELLAQARGQFLDRSVLQFAPERVRSVTLSSAAGTLHVFGQGKHWWLEGFSRADPNKVDDLIMGLLDLRFDQVMPALEPVETPQVDVRVKLEDGTTHVLAAGEETPMGVRVDAGMARGMVYGPSLALLGQGPTDVADRSLIPFDGIWDDQVELRQGQRHFTAVRENALWRAEGIDDAEVGGILRRLGSVQIVYGPEPVAPPARVWMTASVSRGADIVAVDIGPDRDDGFRHVVDRAGGQPYRIQSADLAFLDEIL
jgi:hypothetical protein